jgi:redox-sensitive bicupin YhaK (pirin superfamily)
MFYREQEMDMKKIVSVGTSPKEHWVGDGFAVRSLFSYDDPSQVLSPFLLLDYAAPRTFTPAAKPRGVGEHPHRGFETVTIVYQGEVEHRDSSGGGGKIGPGDVQWMTAAAGILHDEFHSQDFTRTGGTMEMVQLWVNLPAKDKMSAPKYQTLRSADIPSIALANDAGHVRVIAGEYGDHRGPAQTFTSIGVWDVRLRRRHTAEFAVPEGHTLALIVMHGTVLVNGTEIAREAQMVLLERAGRNVMVEANGEATFLVLSGEPIDEPVVGHGPFVMNSEAEIHQAITDFTSGRFGHLAA